MWALLPLCYHFATGFSARLVYRRAERSVNCRRGSLLHAWNDVAVSVDRQRHAAVPKPLTDDLRMDIALEHDRRVAVPEIVKPNARQFGRR